VTITNSGGGGGSGRVGINLYLSASGMLDSSAVLVAAPSSSGRAITLASGKTATFVVPFVGPHVAPGTYTLLAQLVPLARFTADEASQLAAAAPSTLVSAGNVFGTVGKHHLSLTISDASGNSAVLSLTGPGLGSVTQSGGVTDLVVAGTNPFNTLRITTSGAPFTFRSITVTGALKSFVGYQAAVTQSLSIAGGVSRVSLAGAGTPAGPGASVTLGGTTPLTLSLGNMEGATLGTSAFVRSLTAAAWNAGAILAPYIKTLTVNGPMSASVDVSGGGRVESATVGTLAGGTWAVSGSLLSLRVLGAMANARIFAGADAGSDNVLGTADDVYRRAMINSTFVGGDLTSGLVAAGAAPPSGQTIDTAITLLPHSAIRSITVGGALSGDSRFLASSLPPNARVNGARVSTAGDPRFHP
jgi:hypothetical protein